MNLKPFRACNSERDSEWPAYAYWSLPPGKEAQPQQHKADTHDNQKGGGSDPSRARVDSTAAPAAPAAQQPAASSTQRQPAAAAHWQPGSEGDAVITYHAGGRTERDDPRALDRHPAGLAAPGALPDRRVAEQCLPPLGRHACGFAAGAAARGSKLDLYAMHRGFCKPVFFSYTLN